MARNTSTPLKQKLFLRFVIELSDMCRINAMNCKQDGTSIDKTSRRTGFRSVKLIQEAIEKPDQYGTGSTFLFEINGVRMFMGGMKD